MAAAHLKLSSVIDRGGEPAEQHGGTAGVAASQYGCSEHQLEYLWHESEHKL